MFAPDVMSLREFYATPLGIEAHALVKESLHELWPEMAGDTLLGLGFATPYLQAYAQEGNVWVCMPAAQGAAYWPPGQMNRTFLSHESELPLQDNSVNRVLLAHSVENSEQLSGMMREIWRVLTPGGRMIAIVPNRLGFWSRSSRTPFGYGRPFSLAQMRDLVSSHQFTMLRSRSALFLPPTRLTFLWRMAERLEKIGKLFCGLFGGVLLIEAEKQVYAAMKEPIYVRQALRAAPAATPAMSRV